MEPRFLGVDDYRRVILRPLEDATNAMERTGAIVDPDKLHEIATRARREEEALLHQLAAWAQRDVNWSSWPQLAAFLHTDPSGLCLPPSPYWKKGTVEKGEIKTDDRALEYLAGHHEEHRAGLQHLRALRRWQRTANYAEDWIAKAVRHSDGTWRLHPSFGLASDHDNRPGAKTGRFALKNPPINQVPRAGEGPMGSLRAAFVAPPGCRLVVADYSQLEVVILGHLCGLLFGEGELLRYLRERLDIHAAVARESFGVDAPLAAFKEDPVLKVLRTLAKAIVYGLNYGKTTFATSVFLPSGEPLGEERARKLTQGVAAQFPEIGRYQGFVRDWITEHESITSLFGRLMKLPMARARKGADRNRAWRQALNYPMQASGQEIMALALVAIFRSPEMRSLGYTLSMPVHDEIVGWAPEDRAEDALALKKQLMCSQVPLLAPLQAEGHTGANWSEAK